MNIKLDIKRLCESIQENRKWVLEHSLMNCHSEGLHSIVVGESGPKARPMHPDWVRSLRDQCVDAGVPFFFKQWGEWEVASEENGHFNHDMTSNGAKWVHLDGLVANGPSFIREDGLSSDKCYAMIKVGKKKAGRILDGITHDEYPRTSK